MATNGEKSLAHSPSEEMEPAEREAFNRLIRPADMYNENGTYWADLPIGQRVSFVSAVDREESSVEWRWLVDMFKADPLAPVGYYMKNFVLAGAGLGLEGYVDFFSHAWSES